MKCINDDLIGYQIFSLMSFNVGKARLVSENIFFWINIENVPYGINVQNIFRFILALIESILKRFKDKTDWRCRRCWSLRSEIKHILYLAKIQGNSHFNAISNLKTNSWCHSNILLSSVRIDVLLLHFAWAKYICFFVPFYDFMVFVYNL